MAKRGRKGSGDVSAGDAVLKRARGRPRVAAPKVPVLSLRGSAEWREWCERFAAHAGASVSSLCSEGLALLAKSKGFGDPMPPR